MEITCTHAHTCARTHTVSLIRLDKVQNSPTCFLCRCLSRSPAPQLFVSSRYPFMCRPLSLSAHFVSRPLSASTPASLPLPPPFCCFLHLPVYFYISSLVRLICNPTRAASSRLSARQNPLSPALICRPAGCSAAIIRTTVTVAANSLQQEAHIHAAYAVSNTRTCFMCFICSS